ncbi:MAG: hypothetical protein C4326_14710 [Ignavibacteria bacterium]
MDTGIHWFWLIVAAGGGFGIAWFARAQQSSKDGQADNAALAYKLRQRDEELAAARAEITVHTTTLDSLRNELAMLKKKLEAYEAEKKAKRDGARATARSTRPVAAARSRKRKR